MGVLEADLLHPTGGLLEEAGDLTLSQISGMVAALGHHHAVPSLHFECITYSHCHSIVTPV